MGTKAEKQKPSGSLEKQPTSRRKILYLGGLAFALAGYFAADGPGLFANDQQDQPPTCTTTPLVLRIGGETIVLGEKTKHDMRSRTNRTLISIVSVFENSGTISVDCEPEESEPDPLDIIEDKLKK